MNIIVIGKFSNDQFGFHIADTLKDMGHIVFTYDPSFLYKYYNNLLLRRIHQINQTIYNNLLMINTFRNFNRKKLYEIVKEHKIELIICTHDYLYPYEVKKLKNNLRVKVVLWFPDSVANFNKASFLISDYDGLFFKDTYLVKVLREQYNKQNIYYLPECCNPKYHKNVVVQDKEKEFYEADISTYGSPHNIRTSFFFQLLKYNYKIKIWGHQTPIWLKDKELKALYKGVYVFNESKCKAVLAAKININTLHPSEINGLNARTFETAGIGGFQIIHWRPSLQDNFEDGKEIISFNNFDELIDKINYYLDKPNERATIARAGQLRAYKDHTYSHRIGVLFATIFDNIF